MEYWDRVMRYFTVVGAEGGSRREREESERDGNIWEREAELSEKEGRLFKKTCWWSHLLKYLPFKFKVKANSCQEELEDVQIKKKPKSFALGGAGHAVVFGDYLWWSVTVFWLCFIKWGVVFFQFMVLFFFFYIFLSPSLGCSVIRWCGR